MTDGPADERVGARQREPSPWRRKVKSKKILLLRAEDNRSHTFSPSRWRHMRGRPNKRLLLLRPLLLLFQSIPTRVMSGLKKSVPLIGRATCWTPELLTNTLNALCT